MNISDCDVLFIFVIGIITYAYTVFHFIQTPDPSTEFGISLNAMLAGLIATCAAVIAFVVVAITKGTDGYVIAAVIIIPSVYKITKKMTTQ